MKQHITALTLILAFLCLLNAERCLAKEKLAVLDLEAKNAVTKDLAEAVSVILRDEIHKIGRYEVIGKEDLKAIAKRNSLLLQADNPTDGEDLIDFGRSLGSRLLLYGSLAKFGSTYSISLTLLDTGKDTTGIKKRVNEQCRCTQADLLASTKKIAGALFDSMNPNRSLNASSGKDSWVEPITGLVFRKVASGCFSMGGPIRVKGGDDKMPIHEICLDEFFMADREISVEQFGKFIEFSGYTTEAERRGGCVVAEGNDWIRSSSASWKNPGMRQSPNEPAVCISWNDAREFADWLNTTQHGGVYRLPTEAEWEYAAGGYDSGMPPWSADERAICSYANVADQSAKRTWAELAPVSCNDTFSTTAPTGSFPKNDWGIHDIYGNAWEWCEDWYSPGYYRTSPSENPRGPASGPGKVLRGGSWANDENLVNKSFRHWRPIDFADSTTGFRLVFNPI
ncbi:MAG: formylglycine-generating enzyme family protein [Desulfurivibrionaceae bacterium]|nr:formylglycine-generating enzyme family protein [Desulfobulbales bacterium]MDT8334148.1 formylglycine-generating enzyme family protein [Desulfurivibrionaceae bacterium]